MSNITNFPTRATMASDLMPADVKYTSAQEAYGESTNAVVADHYVIRSGLPLYNDRVRMRNDTGRVGIGIPTVKFSSIQEAIADGTGTNQTPVTNRELLQRFMSLELKLDTLQRSLSSIIKKELNSATYHPTAPLISNLAQPRYRQLPHNEVRTSDQYANGEIAEDDLEKLCVSPDPKIRVRALREYAALHGRKAEEKIRAISTMEKNAVVLSVIQSLLEDLV